MCSLFGYIATSTSPIPLTVLYKMAEANVARGPHAFGFAWVTRDGRIRSYKQTGRITDYMGLFAMARDAVMFIGHVRWATHGSPDSNINNHPHPVDGGWLVHNGVVRNYEDLIKEHDLYPVTECDSESIGLIIEREPGRMLARVAHACEAIAGDNAIMALWARPARMVVARAGNPLHTSKTRLGVYFSTSPAGLPEPGSAVSLRDNTASEYTLADDTKGLLNVRICKIKGKQDSHASRYGRAVRSARGGSATAEYRGG